MPFNKPTLAELRNQGAADIESRVTGTDARLRRNNLGVINAIVAATAHGLYAFIDYVSKQVLPDTADNNYLERHAAIHGITRKAAGKATGSVTFTGDDGTLVPAGTIVQRSDQVQFETSAEVVIAAGEATASVTAIEAGTEANTAENTSVNLVNPINFIDSNAIVAAGGIINGVDTESDESLRERVLAKIQQPPHGGADFDYIAWAKEIAGVTRAWVYPQENGLGTVTVRFVVDDDPISLIPDAAKVEEVQDHIDSVRPVTADVLVGAPVAVPLDFTITGLNPGTAAVQAAVEQELQDLLTREAEPGGTILLSHIKEAISIAAGEYDHALTLPAADVDHDTGEIATMGVVTWA